MGVDSSVKYVFMISLTGCQEEDESMRFFFSCKLLAEHYGPRFNLFIQFKV